MKRAHLLCCVVLLVLGNVATFATVVDLTVIGAGDVINDAYFMQVNPTNSSGSGVFDTFLGVGGSGVTKGYNTDGTLEFDTVGGGHTNSLNINAVPTVTMEGSSTLYREFCLDINQNSATPYSLNALEIYLGSTATLSGYEAGNLGDLVYDMGVGNEVLMDYSFNAGSGKADIVVYIPDSLFSGTNEYIYLFSQFGTAEVPNDAGFEEWGVGVNAIAVTPEPATLILFGLGGVLTARKRKTRV